MGFGFEHSHAKMGKYCLLRPYLLNQRLNIGKAQMIYAGTGLEKYHADNQDIRFIEIR